jgi:ribosomal protein S27AE
MNDEKLNRLCGQCGQAFSVFLHEMAKHNAKVTACPKCGKNHEFKPVKGAKPAARPMRKISSKM